MSSKYYPICTHLFAGQWFMVQRDMAQPEESAPQIGRLGRRPLNTFADYAMVAMRKLADRHVLRHEHITAFLSADQDECRRELNAFEQAHTAARCQVAVFWTLRALLAPALERLLLADRVAYLREHGHAAWLVAPFDPTASPRNLAIISVKQP